MNELVQALQEQVSRDFAPLWGINATIHACSPEAPVGQQVIYLVDNANSNGNLGYHIDDTGTPRAYVGVQDCLSYNVSPSTAVSHELLEMLADPTAQRMVGSYLMEVCDPVTMDYYQIGNILVTNFCTPRYFGLTDIGHFDQLGKLNAGIPACTFGGMVMWYDGQKWNQTFARTETGTLSWRAHIQGRNEFQAKYTPSA